MRLHPHAIYLDFVSLANAVTGMLQSVRQGTIIGERSNPRHHNPNGPPERGELLSRECS